MDVFGEIEKLFFCGDVDVFVFALEETAGIVVFVVEEHGIGD